MVVRGTGACLDHNNVSILVTWYLWTTTPHVLAPLDLRLWLHAIEILRMHMMII
jgi:hypothetical protein